MGQNLKDFTRAERVEYNGKIMLLTLIEPAGGGGGGGDGDEMV